MYNKNQGKSQYEIISGFEKERERIRSIKDQKIEILTREQLYIAEFIVENLEKVATCDTYKKLAQLMGESVGVLSATIAKIQLFPYKKFIDNLNILLKDSKANLDEKYKPTSIEHKSTNKELKIQDLYDEIMLLYIEEDYIKSNKTLIELLSINNELINGMNSKQKFSIILIAISFGILDIAENKINIQTISKEKGYWYHLIIKIKDREVEDLEDYINSRASYYNIEEKYVIDLILDNIINYFKGEYLISEITHSCEFKKEDNFIDSIAVKKYSENYLEVNGIDKNLLTNCESKEVSKDSNNESYSNNKNNLIEEISLENNIINETNIQDLYKEIIYRYNKKNYAECKEKLIELLNNTYKSIGTMNSNQTYTMIFLSVPFGILDMVIKKVNIEYIGEIGGFKYDLMMKIVKKDILTIEKFIQDRRKFYKFEESDSVNLILDNIINYYKGKPLISEEKQDVHDFDSTTNNENIISSSNEELCNGDDIELIEKEIPKIQKTYFYILKLYKNGYYIDCRKQLSNFFNLNNKLINDIELNQKYTILFILISFGELDVGLNEFDEELLYVSSECEYNLINKVKTGDTDDMQEYINIEKIHYKFQPVYTTNLILENIKNHYDEKFPTNNFYEQTKEIRKYNYNEHREKVINSEEKVYAQDLNYDYNYFIKNLNQVFETKNIENIKIELKLLNENNNLCKKIIEENKFKDYIIESLMFNIDEILLENELFLNYIKNNRCAEALLCNIYKEAVNTKLFGEVKHIPNIIFNENKDKFLIDDSIIYAKLNRLLNQEYIISQSCLYVIDEDMICKEDNRITNKITTFIECSKNNEMVFVKIEIYICILCEKRYVKISVINQIEEKGYIIKTVII